MRSHSSKVFDHIFEHNRPRVDYYYAALRDAYRQAASVQMPPTLTEDTMKLVSSHRVGAKEWQGIVIDIDKRPTLSWEVADCLSNKERDEAVADMCDSIQTLFMADKAPYHEIRDFIGGFYAAIQNPRERAGLKNLLRQSLHGCERLFSKAWSALLFLARPFDAALVLVELSSTLQPFHSFRFIAIPARKFRTAKYLGMRTSPPLETLIALQCQPQNKEWVEFLQSRKAARVYSNKLGISRSIHAEVQLIGWLESRGFKTVGQAFPYIGCSRKCCFFCELFRTLHRKFAARGTHETVFPRWGLPKAIATDNNLEWLDPIMNEFRTYVRTMLQTVLRMPHPLPYRNLLQQSSAALSTAQARQREEPTFSERPSAVT